EWIDEVGCGVSGDGAACEDEAESDERETSVHVVSILKELADRSFSTATRSSCRRNRLRGPQRRSRDDRFRSRRTKWCSRSRGIGRRPPRSWKRRALRSRPETTTATRTRSPSAFERSD